MIPFLKLLIVLRPLHHAFIVAALVLFAHSTQLYAQSYNHLVYGVEDGLPSFYTKSIFCDGDQHIWIGTDNGLVEFDSQKMILFRDELPSRYIKHIIDVDDKMWVLTDFGLLERLDSSEDKHSFKTLLPATVTLTDSTLHFPKFFFEDHLNNRWIIEPTGVVQLFPDFSFKRHTFSEKHLDTDTYTHTFFPLISNNILFLFSKLGTVLAWNSTSNSFEEYEVLDDGNDFFVSGILKLNDNSILSGGQNGVFKVEINSSSKTIKVKQLFGNFALAGIHQTKDGTILLAERTTGIYSLKNSTSTNATSLSIPFKEVVQFYEDHSGNIWASGDQGVLLIQKNLFESLSFPQQNQVTNYIVIDDNNKVYVAGESAVFTTPIKSQSGKEYLSTLIRTTGSQNLSLAAENNALYIGNTHSNILKFENNTLTLHSNLNLTFPNEPIHPYYLTNGPKKGELWAIIYNKNGVLRILSDGSVLHYDENKGLPTYIRSIVKGADGISYATGDGMNNFLYRLNPETDMFENLSMIESTPFSDINIRMREITTAPDSSLWMVGSAGLLGYKEGSFLFPHEQYNFRYDLFMSVTVDSSNNVWVGAQNGLFTYRKGKFTRFDQTDGLPNLTMRPSSLKIDKEQRIWAGTIDGVARLIRPLSERVPTPKPKISVVKVNGVVQDSQSNLTVPDDATLEFSFWSITYPASKVEYQVRIPGVTDTWSTFSPKTNYLFQQIPAGQYSIQIRAQKRGYPVSEIASIPFESTLPWYRTLKAQFMYFILGIGLFLVIVQVRRKYLHQKRIEKKLKTVESQFRTVLEKTPMILMVINRYGRIDLIEGKGLQDIHQERTKLVGDLIYNVFQDPQFLEIYQRTVSGQSNDGTVTLGNRFFQVEMIPLLDDTQGVEGVLVVGIDISHRMIMESQLRDSKEKAEQLRRDAEQANKAKSLFLASMSHELRTPLNAIIGFSQLLAKDDQMPEKQRGYISIMHKSGEHLLSMINDVLDISKIEAGQLEIIQDDFNIITLLEEVYGMFQLLAKQKYLDLSIEIENDEVEFIIQDEPKIRQVLINLVGNAIKYTDQGKVVLKATINSKEGMATISVQDSGRGIPQNQQVSIFEPFKQVQGVFNRGTGLGLAISYKLATLIGGSLSVISKVSKGSTFTFQFPFNFSSFKQDTRSATLFNKTIVGTQNNIPLSVLVVDDVEENRALVKALLDPIATYIDEAENGLEALEKFKQHRFDLVLLDIVMPIMDGKEAMIQMKQIAPSSPPYFYAITASGFEDEKESILALGFDEYIRKPFRDHELLIPISKQFNIEYLFAEPITSSTLDEIELYEGDLNEEVGAYILSLPKKERTYVIEIIESSDIESFSMWVQKQTLPSKTINHIVTLCESSNYHVLFDLDEWIDHHLP